MHQISIFRLTKYSSEIGYPYWIIAGKLLFADLEKLHRNTGLVLFIVIDGSAAVYTVLIGTFINGTAYRAFGATLAG